MATVKPVIDRYGLGIPVFGLVKDDHHRTRAIALSGGEIAIQQKRAAYTLRSTIQEEVHRFAITFQRQKHKKRTYRSKLDGIPGIGETRKQALLKRFGTVKAIESASLEDLRKVLPAPAALAVYERFHPADTEDTKKEELT